MTAEAAYLFAHAALRDAAYQLHLPSDRARLHHEALHLLERWLPAEQRENQALELAEHARRAQEGVTVVGNELPYKRLEYLRVAARRATRQFENRLAAALYREIAMQPLASPEDRARAWAEAGTLHWFVGLPEQALADHGAAVEASRPWPALHAFALIERGTTYRDLDRNSEAAKDLERALELARACGDKHLQLRALGNLCTVQQGNQTRISVAQLYAPVIRLAEETGDRRALGISMGQIAIGCLESGDHQAAEQSLRQSIAVLHEAGDPLNEAAMHCVLGDVLRRRNGPDPRAEAMAAIAAYREARRLNLRAGNVPQQATVELGLSLAYGSLGMVSECLNHGRAALLLLSELGNLGQLRTAQAEVSNELRRLGVGDPDSRLA
ncbi:MAG: hypothetical protein IT463_02505 [Planctomycetes bacterium]|nr:hypothetical protein [Planctomycetota bacterium]